MSFVEQLFGANSDGASETLTFPRSSWAERELTPGQGFMEDNDGSVTINGVRINRQAAERARLNFAVDTEFLNEGQIKALELANGNVIDREGTDIFDKTRIDMGEEIEDAEEQLKPEKLKAQQAEIEKLRAIAEQDQLDAAQDRLDAQKALEMEEDRLEAEAMERALQEDLDEAERSRLDEEDADDARLEFMRAGHGSVHDTSSKGIYATSALEVRGQTHAEKLAKDRAERRLALTAAAKGEDAATPVHSLSA